MGAMTLSATREWDFSSEQGKANYKAAQRRYPAQAIVDLAALRDNMRHLVSVVAVRIPAPPSWASSKPTRTDTA